MPHGANDDKRARSNAQIRQDRLAAELRSNLAKRKAQARSRAVAQKAGDKEQSSGPQDG